MEEISQGPEERIARFIRDSFELRKCHRYVKVDDKTFSQEKFLKANDCTCGQPLEWHLREKSFKTKQAEKTKEWNQTHDTRPYPCDTFGKIKFYPGETIDPTTVVPGASAKYVRLAGLKDEKYLKLVYDLLTSRRYFNIPKPQLVIEITGSASEFVHVDKRIIDRFNTSLIDAACNANAWLVTGGTHTGVMRLVGDAVTKYRLINRDKTIPCIGIVSWGIVNDREKLIGSRENDDYVEASVPNADNESGFSVSADGDIPGRWPADYFVQDCIDSTDYPSLDPGHNCFLLVDNAKEKRFGEEIDFRCRFVEFISRLPLQDNSPDSQIPSVLLVMGGGPNTLKTIEESVCHADGEKKGSGMQQPVIILPGFGGAGDLLAFGYTISSPVEDRDLRLYYQQTNALEKGNQKGDIPFNFDERLRKHPEFYKLIRKYLPKKENSAEPNDEIDKLRRQKEDHVLQTIRKILLENRNFISLVDIFSPKQDDNGISLSRSIMDAIIKSNSGRPATNFLIAELWNRADVAASILHEHHRKIFGSKDLIEAGIKRAIEFDQPQFLDIYLKYGRVDLNKFLTEDRVKHFFLDIFINQKVVSARAYAKLFRTLLANATNDEAVFEPKNDKLRLYFGIVLSDLLGCYMDNTFTGDAELLRRSKGPYDCGVRDIFLLSLLLNRSQMAVRLWILGRDHMGSCLMASNFLKSLRKEAARLDFMDIASSYQEQAREWQHRAITLLTICYDQDQQRCFQLLTRSLQMWQGLTVLEMAYYGRKLAFMDQPAVQVKLNMIWLGRIATFTKTWLIYFTMVPFLLPGLIFQLRFEESSIQEEKRETVSNSSQNSQNRNDTTITIDRRFSIVNADEEQPTTYCCPPAKQAVGPSERAFDRRQSFAVGSSSSSDKTDDVILLRAGLRSNKKEKTISIFEAGYYLYSSPLAKFTIHSIALAIFLFLYSYFIFVGTKPNEVTAEEIVIWIWACVYMMDKFRMFYTESSLSLSEKVINFFHDMWLVTESIAFALLVAALIQRFVLEPENFIFPRTTYAVSCLVYWFQAIRYFYMTESLGPKMVVAAEMFKDLAFFVVMYSMVVLAFSVPIHALLYPEAPIDNTRSFLHLLLDVSYGKMWMLFITNLDETLHETEGTCPANASVKCSHRNIVAIILYIVFLLLTNIILLKMLIAFFAGTIQSSRSMADRMWRFGTYRFMYEYYHKPILPGPLMIFELLYRLFMAMHKSCKKDQATAKTDFKEYFNDGAEFEYRRLEMFERSAVERTLEEVDKSRNRDPFISELSHVHQSLKTRMIDVEERLEDIFEETVKAIKDEDKDQAKDSANERVVTAESVRLRWRQPIELPKSNSYV